MLKDFGRMSERLNLAEVPLAARVVTHAPTLLLFVQAKPQLLFHLDGRKERNPDTDKDCAIGQRYRPRVENILHEWRVGE